MALEKIVLKIKNELAYIDFFHLKANALDEELIKDLTKTFNELEKKKEVKGILFSSKNEAVFSAGLFLDDLAHAKELSEVERIFSNFSNLLFTMINCSKPIIGIFLGKAVGGGLGLLAACDYVFAHQGAQIKLSELSIGIAPLLIEPIVSNKINKGPFFEIALNPEKFFEASWAYQKGLINEIIQEKFDVKKQAEIFCKNFSNYNEKSFYELKKTKWENINSLKKMLKKRAFINAKLYFDNRK